MCGARLVDGGREGGRDRWCGQSMSSSPGVESAGHTPRSPDLVHQCCPQIGSGDIPAMSSTGCFFNVSQLLRFLRQEKVVKKSAPRKKKKCLKEPGTEATVQGSAKVKSGKVKKVSKKEQERVLCGTVKLGKV